MRIFLYEFVTGGGWFSQPGDAPPPESLAREGRAMLAALATDLAASGASVDVLCDARDRPVELSGVTVHSVASAEAERQAISRLAGEADWTVLIAPEFDGHLLSRARQVEDAGGRLLGPSPELIALAADKHATAEHLAQRRIRVPHGIALPPGGALPADFAYPAVLKPRDGAGSLGVEWVDAWPGGRIVAQASRLEAYCPGIAASVACLCGPDKIVPLTPCRQSFSHGFSYRGGSLPLEPYLAGRARSLAVRAVAGLPRPLGYLGVDLILADADLGGGATGSDDLIVEINPRLTTSYVGLRALSRVNLAEAMARIACGHDIELCWNIGEVHFTSAGALGSRPDHQ